MTKKEQIIQKSLELLVKQGIQETPMSQISKESGVAVGTIYHHFKSKKEIINYIYLQIKKEMGEIQMQKVLNTSAFKLQFFQVWNNLFAYFVQQPLKFEFTRQIANLPIIDRETIIEGQQYNHTLISFFNIGISEGVLKPMNVQLMAEMLQGNILTLAHMHHQKMIELNKTVLLQAIIMSWEAASIKNV